MACFVVPVAQAVVTTVAAKVIEVKEKKCETVNENVFDGAEKQKKISFSSKLGWLNNMLWGGSALLMLEHLWHGEITASFPFLSAFETGEVAEMLSEMSSTGVLMSVLVTVAWAGMVAVTSAVQRKSQDTHELAEGEV